ncbi:RNA polymerase sigma-70 factor (plasmid) [Pedobacter sp. BS3]|uniref:RNA polymerase sigma factor n=1 Tax=Pedobacter sp. BS3 TaxID=2567937 RepID=UPI0011EFED28|nr:RNA polymerase sigma-70 factor [Pedobacter sp. BS3]TZF85918.1 RNA polymerase sigma-70 factor [Pedobacter sp. BS3]
MTDKHNQPEKDRDIIEAIRLRDRKVFETLYKTYYTGLYTLSYRYVGQHEIAEEMVNDVFISIWHKADHIQIESSMKNYLIRSVINTSLNYIKKEKGSTKKQEKYGLDNSETEELTDSRYEEQENLLLRLEKALELLPPQCKKVMMMSRFEKMKQQEIADSLNISIKTVKNHLTYGFARLRQVLAVGTALLIIIISAAIAVLK